MDKTFPEVINLKLKKRILIIMWKLLACVAMFSIIGSLIWIVILTASIVIFNKVKSSINKKIDSDHNGL